MDRIIAPILRNDRGSAVHNLQDGLLLLLGAAPAEPPDPGRQPLIDKLSAEQREDVYGDVTTEDVARFQREHRTAFALPLDTGEQVDDATAAAMNRMLQELGVFERIPSNDFLITGRVEFEDGSTISGLRVAAFDRDLGSRRVLVGDPQLQIITGDDGVFPTIRYRAGDVTEGEGRAGPNADLIFEVTGVKDQRPREITALYRHFGIGTEKSETQVSDLMLGFEAAQLEDVRIVLTGRPSEEGRSEYKRLMLALEPMLIERATPADFDQDHFRDIDFAARETDWDRNLIETLTLAWRLAQGVSREPQLLAETFYGLLRHGAPTEVAPLASTLPELLEQDTRWSSKLDDSLAHRIIDGDLELHLTRLRALRTDAATLGADSRRGGIGDVLAGAGVAEGDRRALLEAYHAHRGPIEAFWTDVVSGQLGWAPAKVLTAQTAIQLADILSYDMPLIARLRSQGLTAPRDLVKLERTDWVEHLKSVGPSPDAPGANPDEQITNSVNAITAVIDATYPTETIARIAAVSRDSKLEAARDLLSRFFERETAMENGEKFDVRTTPVTAYLEANADRVFAEIRGEDKTLLTSQLQRLQRVFRLGIDRSQTEKLLDLGLDSAFHVTRFSPEHFATEFGEQLGGAERASLVYGRAEQIAGTVLYMYTDLWQGVHSVKPMAIMSSSEPGKIPALTELPAYKALFGSLDLCECSECQSFYSPAAYFVDLLHMLDRKVPGGANPADVLFLRRPDLAHIQLTCENTNTLIPYVDLVTEVLESFVANRAPAPFNLPPSPPNRRLPSPSAEELRVNPVYLTAASSTFADQAYATLQEAVFPLTLPLNVPLETTRTYLDNLGVSRAELMTLLEQDTGLEALMARAAEILLLSPEEFELVTGAQFGGASSLRPASTAEFFGLSITGSPTTLFNHAAPEFVRNTANPDERGALISSLQNILSLISPSPIPVAEWGTFGAATEAVINAYLKKKGLPQNGRTDDVFWGALEADGKPSLAVMVCPVPMFLDRSGLTYEELIALVKTRFVNPMLQGEADFDYLARLGMPAADVRAWIEAGLPPMPPPIQAVLTAAGEDPAAFTAWVKRRTRAVVINTSFESPCDLDRATLMHLDGTLLSPGELVTLFRFIRLWRKLGWTLDEMDPTVEPGALESNAVFGTVLLLANVKQLREQLNAPVSDIVSLWQSIPKYGSPAVYDHLFRNRAAQLIDPILELNRDHTELKAVESATPPALSDHVGPVLAGFRLSAQDLALLRVALKLEDDVTLPPAARPKLDLATLSAIYRHVTLARALGLSIRDLLGLIGLSGLTVFERPDRFPRGSVLLFADIVAKVKQTEVKAGALVYLCRAELPDSGLPATQSSAWIGTLADLVDGLRAISVETSIKDDPAGEELTARLTSLIGPDDARMATALIYGRDVYTTSLPGLPAGFLFPAAVSARVSYDASRKILTLRGAMTATERILLLAAPGVPVTAQPAYDRAIKAIDGQARTFVLRALKAMFAPGEAEAALIDISSLDASGAPVQTVLDTKIEDVIVRRQAALNRSLIKQTFTTATGLNADVVGLLLENETVLTSVSGTGPTMGDYQKLEGDGLDGQYFSNPDLKGAAMLQRIDETIAFDLQGAAPAPGVPAVGFSVRWTGTLYVPAAGKVAFRVRCTDGIRLTVNDVLFLDEWRDQSESEFNATVRLDGGQFYPIEVHYYNKTGGALLELGWSSPSIPASVIPQEFLYTATRFEVLLQRIERIYKIAFLLAPFGISAPDLKRLAEHGDIALDTMPIAGPAGAAAAQAMFAQWLALCDFSTLRDRWPSSDVSLMDLTGAPDRAEAVSRFARLTGVAAETLDAIIDAFVVRVFDLPTTTWKTVEPDLSTLAWWNRIADLLGLVQRTGAAPEKLLGFARAREIKELPAGPETQWFVWTASDADKKDRHADNTLRAQEAKNLVRARYDEDRWRAEGQKLNDLLRIRRRSALTGFVLAMPEMMRARVSDTGRLFEFMLIDVEMDPCTETSRIKQGISSVQLFVQRVLLGLEAPLVPAMRVDAHRWEWMKNYRVSEANRKVLLHAESYTEEALRDDKTPIFKDLEAELLQDDLTDANAERAVRHYLETLDGIAKLIICGTCVDSDAGVLHVFGRTSTTPVVFYHRWLENKSGLSWTEGVWSPWQKLPVDVAAIDDGEDSGAHLMPIMWNRRLYLFWPVFEQKSDELTNAKLNELSGGFDQISCWHVKIAWSEYKDGRWTSKQTGVPFLASRALVENLDGAEFWHDVGRADPYFRITYTTGRIRWRKVDKVEFVVGELIVATSGTTIVPFEIPDDEMLRGTKLEQAADWASHEHSVNGFARRSLLPKPADHYLDARIDGSGLTIQLFARFRGIPTGQGRSVVEDKITVVRGGTRMDRKEQSQNDFRSTGRLQHVFKIVGKFQFPACTSNLIASQSDKMLDYNSLERPQNTANSFMGLHYFQSIGRIKTALLLTNGASPILESGSVFFDVIDSDNRSGFNRKGPFFYQDQRRCYLVTHETYAKLFDDHGALQVQPDSRGTKNERASTLATLVERHGGVAANSDLRVNPWSQAALASWSSGPGLSAALRSDAAVVTTARSGSLDTKSVLESDSIKNTIDAIALLRPQPEYTFTPYWHPYTCSFISALNSGGFPALFSLDTEILTDAKLILAGVIGGPMPIFTANTFDTTYRPDPAQVVKPYPVEEVDFSRTGAYAKYNWEIFFHTPMTIAAAYTRAGQYEAALRWFHFVFFPMTGDNDTSPARAWRFLPFRTADTARIEDALGLLTYTGSDPAKLKERTNLQASIQEWIDNPFNPHIIARRRPVVYMKYVFMKYLDNLIAWADELFLRDTMESINEATQLYVLAANLLGPRPQRTPAPEAGEPETFQSLRPRLDALSNAQVDLETRLPFTQLYGPGTGTIGQLTQLPQALYFCLPQNENMLGYWDTIADRLFKIRHCMSFDGTVRQLPLFDQPIDPMLLVEAVAHGVDIGSVLNDLYAPLPRYRFTSMLQQALALCSEVRSLGSTLLSVLEKRDAEGLATLRAKHETLLLDQLRTNKKLQIDEAEQTRLALENTVRMTTARIEYYDNLIAQGLISEEKDNLLQLAASNERQAAASWIEATAQMLNLIPNLTGGSSPGSTFGGSNLGSAASAVGKSFSGDAAAHAYLANRASITGGHARRMEDWRFQRDHARRELAQVERQSAAAAVRKAFTEADLRSHEMQLEHSRGMEDRLRIKFTNDALYGWMEGQLRTVYFQCYQAAYEVARGTQRTFQYQLGTNATYVSYGAWDSSVRGLLAGERLYQQLKQMERAYIDQQVREFEIAKHVSVVQLDPLALIALKETGICEVEIPEWLFDLDYPGHYFRRLKTVSITIPAVVGPYTSVSATVTLLRSQVRESARVAGTYGDDANYRPDHLAVEAIVASTAQNDSGRFLLDFRDEKYFPFEGAGAISRWRIELPRKFRSFDYDTISDVVLHLKYTARRDEMLAGPALAALEAELAAAGGGTLIRLFSLRHEFPNEWQMLRTANTHTTILTITKERFPLLVQGGAINITELHAALILKEARPTVTYKATLTPAAGAPIDLLWPGAPGRYRSDAKTVTIPVAMDSGWRLQVTVPTLPADLDKIQDILIVGRYSVKM